MSNLDKTRKFLSYIKTPLTQNSLNILYNANNVKYERCQLFSDFTKSLICKITDTYMGDNITKPEQRVEHFKWCWKTTISDFEAEGITFNDSGELYQYFTQHMMETFYLNEDKGDMEIIKHKLIKLWGYILSNTTNKTRSDVDAFLDIYKIFEKTL